MSQPGNGTVKHDGTAPGYLYMVAEEARSADVYPHPHPVNAGRWEWLTTLELPVELIEQTQARADERLTDDEIAEFQQKQAAAGALSFVE